jgi:hypothetical protein
MTAAIQTKSLSDRLIGRAKAILLSPKTEWPVIAAEPATVASIYRDYVLILSAIPAIAWFLEMSVIGYSVPFLGTFRLGIASGLTGAVMQYLMSVVGTFLVTLIIEALAPTFGGVKDRTQALKTAAYSYTAVWIASIGMILPLGTVLMIVGGIYSIYLLYLGLPVTMQAAKDKAVAYTAVTVLCAIVLFVVMGMIVGAVAGTGAALSGFAGVGGVPTASDVKLDPNSALGQLEAYGKRMEQANKQYETAQKSGNEQAQQNALGALLGTALGGDGKTEALAPDQLRGFVPERLGSLARTEVSAERNAMLGIQVAEAHATYTDGADKTFRLEITDLGGAAGLGALASWANIEEDKQTDSGYEKTYKQNGRVIHEVWNKDSKSGEYELLVGNRFTVKVSGPATVDELRTAANSIDLAKLQTMAAK